MDIDTEVKEDYFILIIINIIINSKLWLIFMCMFKNLVVMVNTQAAQKGLFFLKLF